MVSILSNMSIVSSLFLYDEIRIREIYFDDHSFYQVVILVLKITIENKLFQYNCPVT